ncbi:split ends Protein [Schistosoma japonicum]|nr:split ends Protein [Schistosoma japonicum]KAH8850727.1 split ends Protein [Schistosoma japonicum]KAH8850728.1 split ends Protein [Schistosoma japonicum]KAH8850729.1 split ends Protein [Schistosoma japonicum]
MNVSPRFQNEHRGLKISHLPLRSSDTNLREGLFHEYKKHGKITSVFVRGQDEERICIITFKKSEDAEKALASSKGKVFFGTQISVQPHEGLNSEDPDLCPPEHALDEYHPKATKTLFVGNLCSGTITQDELRRTFRGYGEIIEIDIKIQANQPGTSYAFIQYGDIKSVVRALKEQEAIRVGGKPVKLGFGKSQPTNVVWLDNLSPTINEAFLSRQFGRYGQLSHVVLDRKSMRALLYFDNVEVAQHAVNETRNRALVGRKVQIDYAGYECQVAFMKKLAKHGSFGQVYENYKERLQEVLSLLPYGSVIPYLGDRQRYFVDSQREHFPSGNTKFSYRRSNCLRNSPVDHSSKYEQSLSRAKCAPSVSPHNRSHQSSDRRRTFITSSPDDLKISSNWICSHGNRNSHSGKSDTKIVQNEDRSSILSHRRHQHNETSIKSKSLRYLSHAEVKSDISSRTHVDHSSLRSRGQLLEETDDISSGSFSSGFTNDDSFFETSSLKHSNGSSEYSAPTSKLLSHVRDHVLNSDKRRNVDSDASQKSSRINRYEVESLDECSYSLNKKHTLKTRDSMSPQTRVAPMRSSVGRSRMTSSQHGVHSVTDRNLDSRQSSQECPGENNDQRHNKAGFHSQGRGLLKPPDPDYSSPNYSAKPKRVMLSRVTSIYKDVEHSRQANISTVSPISPDDAAYNKSEGAYERVSNSMCSDIPSAVKSHDTLTKLEMERAKLLRELSLLNNEVIGGSRGKAGSITLNKDNSSRKRTPSSSFFNDLPSTKLKCVENSYKCEPVSVQSPTFTNDNLTSPEFRKSTSSAHSIRLMSTSHDSKCELSCSKQGVCTLPTDCHSNITDVASPTRRRFLQAHDLRNIHSNPRLETVFSATVISTATSPSVLTMSVSRQPVLMTSSPRMAIAPEPTSPLIHISPPSSPMIMDKLSYTSTPSTSLSSSVLSASNSGSIISSHANLCSRDPRLALHHTQLYNDVPPPPPEIFKLPLWVDTSPHTEIMVSNLVTSSIMKTQSPGFKKSLCDVEPDISVQDSSGCSLDERIRLLDVQLLKSEKARPTVDYSKFRIRRKAEANSTPQSTEISSASQCITGVSVISCSPHSPIMTTSACPITTRSELTVTDIVGSGLSVSCSSASISSTSPILSNSTPLNLVKPADTSEFVKSMLSFSKPSPSTPCDISNNPLSNEMLTTSRHATLVPLSQSSFLTRLPRSSVSNSLSTANSIQTSVSFCSKQKSANSSNIHFNVGNVEHSSLSGAHPVGVATRMPSVKMFCGSDATKPENNDLVDKGDIKSNTTRDIFDYVEKPEPVVLSHSLTISSAEYNTSVSHITDNQKCSDVSSKAGVHGVSPLLGASNGFPIKSSQKQLTYPTSSCLKSSPRDDNVNSNKCKSTPLLNVPLTNTKKTQKLDSSRPILDDFVFQNSLGGNASKTNRLKKPQLKISSSSLPTKHKPSTTSHSKDVISTSTANKVMLRNISVAKSKTSQKVSRKNISKKLESTSVSSLQKDSLPNNKSQLTVDSNQSTSSANNYSSLCSERKPISPHSKKRKNVRDIKKKVIDSEDSDWEPNTITSSQHPSGELLDPDSSTESHYESMYDKIKRRANQSVTKPVNSVMKRDALQRLLKNKGRELKKPYSNKSLIDSDTDECLSDDSSIHSDDTSNTSTKHSTKPNSSSNEIMSKSIRRKISTTSGAKSHNSSSLSPKRKRIVADSEASGLKESSRKTRGRKAKKSNVSSKPRSLNTQVRRNHKGVEQRESVTTSNCRSITRRKKPCMQKENISTRGNESKIVSGSIDLTVQSKTHKEKAVLSANKQCPVKKTHRSLVHRVFASTDSSSLSSMISESSDDDLSSNQVPALSVREKIDETDIEVSNCQSTKTKSPTLQLSRSCSPEDLRADAAIRHTFGAFTAPFICFKTDPSHGSTIKHNPPQNADVNTKFSPNSEDSKPTPPTLPMTDSSFNGDQQSIGVLATKPQARDPSDWNIFSSLAKQSTPIKDDIMHQHLSSTSGLAVESDELPVNFTADASYDTEDELPSLEKHDDDEANFPCESSILLHERNSPNNHVGSLNTYNDDDLPPPVVSDVSHQLNFSSLPSAVETVPDIIEEVIYDGLEVPIQDETHLTTNTSIKSDSCRNSPIVNKSVADVLHNVIEPTSKNLFMDITSHVDPENISNTSLNVKSSVAVPIITSSLSTVSAQSIVFTSVPMLNVTTQSSEVPIVSKSMLVTISTTTPTNLSSSNCVLRADREASVSQSYPSVSFSLNSVPQNHIAVILPTTTVSFPLTSFVTMSSSISESSTNVTPSTSVIKLRSSPLSLTCSSTTTQNSVSLTDYQQSQSVTSHLPTTGITTPIRITTSLSSSTPTSHVSLSSVSQTGNAVFNPSDFTSYVQRVIERVKQEKDEETLQQREKVKRPKRNASISLPSVTCSTISYTNTSATITSSGVFSPNTVNLPNIAPISSPDVLKPSCVGNIDDKIVTVPVSIPYSHTVVQDSFSYTGNHVISPNPQCTNIADPPITSLHSQQLATNASIEQNLCLPECNNLNDDIHSRDPVDETIEAVVNGEFDEKEYVLKLLKGNFIPNGHYRTLSGTIGSPTSHPDIFTLVSDVSSIKGDHQSGISGTVCMESPCSTVNAGVHSSCTLSVNKGFPDPIISINQSSSVLTPMHVLTFVAAGAATSTSQHKSTSAISPNVPTQSLANLSTSTHHLPSASNPSSSTSDNVSSVTPLTAYASIPNRSDSLPTDSTNTQIGEFAARLANNPFTTYFYSLLTQKQLSPSLSPSIASGDTICQRPADNPSLPLCSSSTLKNLSIPNASVSGDTADYLAAATMAAMAAMAGPTQDMTTFSQTVASASYSDSKSISTDNQLLQLWSAAHLEIQEYPIIWRGRLSLKNEEVFVNMHYVSGNQDLLKICMSVISEQQVALTNIATSSNSLGSCMTTDAIAPTHQPLKIVQRMRLEASQLEGVQRKLRQLNDFCMCLTLAAAPPQTSDASLTNEQIRMNRILCDGFIKYMLEKCAAGIINVCHPCTQQNMYVIHIFPPCEFSRCQLQGYAPALYHSLEENPIPHVLTVITTV